MRQSTPICETYLDLLNFGVRPFWRRKGRCRRWSCPSGVTVVFGDFVHIQTDRLNCGQTQRLRHGHKTWLLLPERLCLLTFTSKCQSSFNPIWNGVSRVFKLIFNKLCDFRFSYILKTHFHLRHIRRNIYKSYAPKSLSWIQLKLHN